MEHNAYIVFSFRMTKPTQTSEEREKKGIIKEKKKYVMEL